MNKKVIFKEEARSKVLVGVNNIVDTVKLTLGASGRNVAIDSENGLHITKDGNTIIQNISFKDSLENIGAKLIQQAAAKTDFEVGDSTTSTSVLSQALMVEGIKYLASGLSPTEINKSLDKLLVCITDNIKTQAVPVDGNKDLIRNVATISANNNLDIGTLISDAYNKVGANGVITIEKTIKNKSYLELIEGFKVDNGYLNHMFINDHSTSSAVLDNPLILLTDKKILTVKDLIKIIEGSMAEKRPLLIIADSIVGEAEASLTMNRSKGLEVYAVTSPEFGTAKRELLDDLAPVIGATVVSEVDGLILSQCGLEVLGSAEKVVITSKETFIMRGNTDEERLKNRITLINQQFTPKSTEFEKLMFRERLGKINGKFAVIHVGGSNEVESNEKYDLYVDSLSSTKSAVESGVVIGGGGSFIRSIRSLDSFKTKTTEDEAGLKIMKKALESPFRQIIINGGLSPDVVLDKVINNKSKHYGFNIKKETYVDMFKEGIINSAKADIVSLQNAVGVAQLFFTLDAAVIDDSDKID